MSLPKLEKTDLTFNTVRQKELMRVILGAFGEYDKRKQNYYLVNGVTTAQLTLRAIQDFDTLRAFWPRQLIKKASDGSTLYGLQEDTLNKVQSNVRSCFDQLEGRSYLERMGNEEERRWRPNKSLRGVTL